MGNNFEAKHPRAKDGKFTEKYRAESGLELSMEKPFTPPDTPEGCERGQVFVGKVKYHNPNSPIGDRTEYVAPSHNEILDGDWWLVEKTKYEIGGSGLTYQTSNGFVQEFYGREGNLEEQAFYDRNFQPAQDAENWTEKQWYENGKLANRKKNLIPENKDNLEFLKDDIEDAGGAMFVAQYFNRQGQQDGENYYEVSGGEIFDVEEYYPDGQTRSKISRSFDGIECAPENESCYYRVSNGDLQVDHYKVKRGRESVYHRTDGPAIIDYREPEEQRYRYFIEGKEYSKDEWEKKLGHPTDKSLPLRRIFSGR